MIYLIKVEKHNIYKIGYTNNIDERLQDLQGACPFKLSVHKTIDGEMIKEKILHRMYFHRQVLGEWFNFNKGWLKIVINSMNLLENINDYDLNIIQNDFYTKEYENIRELRTYTKTKLNRAIKSRDNFKTKLSIIEKEKKKNNTKQQKMNLEKRKKWYKWKVRAKKVNIPPLKNCRPTQNQRHKWEQSIIKAESINYD